MKSHYFYSLYLGLLLLSPISSAQAWRHEVSAGYGFGQEVQETYDNHIAIVNGTIYRFNKIDNTLYASLDGTLANLTSDTPYHNSIFTSALSLGFRAYFQNPDFHKIRPYVGASFGGAYISHKELGTQRQGAHFDFQTLLGAGIEFGLAHERSLDFSWKFIHFCNAGLALPNEGFDVPFIFSIGYQF